MSAAYLSLLLADGRLPTGAHTQSAGVEPAFAAGMRLDQVPAYLSVRLQTVTETEAAAAVLARHRWLTADDRERALAGVDAAWRARTMSEALRAASDLLGRGYLRLASTLWDLDPLTGRARPWCRAVVVGATAAVAGLSAVEVARLVGFDDVQMVIAAALKLKPFDPATGVTWAAAAGPEVEAMAERVSDVCHPDQIPARVAPLVEHWAQQHQHTERRLFRA